MSEDEVGKLHALFASNDEHNWKLAATICDDDAFERVLDLEVDRLRNIYMEGLESHEKQTEKNGQRFEAIIDSIMGANIRYSVSEMVKVHTLVDNKHWERTPAFRLLREWGFNLVSSDNIVRLRNGGPLTEGLLEVVAGFNNQSVHIRASCKNDFLSNPDVKEYLTDGFNKDVAKFKAAMYKHLNKLKN